MNASHNAVFSFLKNRQALRAERGLFYEGLPADLRDQLLKRLAAEWTHESTAIEGNTLNLGETVKILDSASPSEASRSGTIRRFTDTPERST